MFKDCDLVEKDTLEKALNSKDKVNFKPPEDKIFIMIKTMLNAYIKMKHLKKQFSLILKN